MISQQKIKLIECPRDAMQGWPHQIPTKQKIDYINTLLKVGFDTIDFGSFVSPKAIPQMADTAEVLKGINMDDSTTGLLAIIANVRGAQTAVDYDKISFLGYPFSVSETFQHRNTNASISDSFENLKAIQELCVKKEKKLVVYISMGFGNPYGDPFDEEIVFSWTNRIASLGVGVISLADTVGVATSHQIEAMTGYLIRQMPETEIGVHLHSTPHNLKDKLEAALSAGCTRFDGAIRGIGGCPMAGDELVGNMNTEIMMEHFRQAGRLGPVNQQALADAIQMATEIFI